MSGTEPSGNLWLGTDPLVLASTSRTRRELLTSAGLMVEPVAPGIDERVVEADATGLAPVELALSLAAAKAQAVSSRLPNRIVVGADQVLDLDGRVFHKPVDANTARAHLAQLQGRRHTLHSAVTIVHDGEAEAFCESAHLTIRPLGDDAIAAYVALAGETVTASVGAYQLEGLGIHLFEQIEGDHSTILGLPLLPLLARLRRRGLLAF